jgi:predicted transcriptional regulator
MRTTVRLPDDLYDRVRAAAARERRTVTSYIEESLREALLRQRRSEPARPVYVVEPVAGRGVQPGVDLDDSAALLDLMDADARG